MDIVTTSPKGQVVIPAGIRKALHIEPGQKVTVSQRGKEIVIKPLPKDPINSLRGKFAGGDSMTEALREDRKEDAEREESKVARFLRRPRMASG